ncbi:MAG: hypothetical protein H7X93_02180 [Sphingomonadaceae bacterium]|nr:hypothetical protein [Sphingomonadaceae bacterium]
MQEARAQRRYPPLTAALIKRQSVFRAPPERPIRLPMRSEIAENMRLFTITWAGGFVFFLTLIG